MPKIKDVASAVVFVVKFVWRWLFGPARRMD